MAASGRRIPKATIRAAAADPTGRPICKPLPRGFFVDRRRSGATGPDCSEVHWTILAGGHCEFRRGMAATGS